MNETAFRRKYPHLLPPKEEPMNSLLNVEVRVDTDIFLEGMTAGDAE